MLNQVGRDDLAEIDVERFDDHGARADTPHKP